MTDTKKSISRIDTADRLDGRQRSRRRFVQAAATLTGATLIASGAAANSNKHTAKKSEHIENHGNARSIFGEQPILPSWAIGPFTRYENPQTVPYQGNPILKPEGEWEGRAAYNPGVVYRNGKFHMLYRGQPQASSNISQIGYAYSSDGYHFARSSNNPVITNNVPNGSAGAEDPRLYELNGKYYAFFTGYSGTSIDIDGAVSTDLVHWTHIRTVVKNTKNAAVIADPTGRPVKIDGRYAMYYGQNGNGTSMLFSDDMIHWGDATPIELHLPTSYTPYEICIAVTDYPTIEGAPRNRNILMFVAGSLMAQGRWYYAISEIIFSRQEPTRQLDQLTFPILQPRTSYELLGQTKRTVFMNTIMFHKGWWWMYYGAGDTVVGLATASLRPSDSTQRYSDFVGTSFEAGQRQPDWVNQVDTSPGGGGMKNVGAIAGTGGGSKAPPQYNAKKFGSISESERNTPEAIVRYGEKSHSGDAALWYSGVARGKTASHAFLKIFDLSGAPISVKRESTLSYWIYPQRSKSSAGANNRNSASVALDLIFSDGTALRSLKALDQHGHRLTPTGQGPYLNLDQWNHVEVNVGAVASGKRIVRIDLGYTQTGANGSYHGYVDDIELKHF